jgi:hypothetical protein
MLTTYLELVNNVLIRLRETTVSSVGDTPYSSLIGVLVNDAKREIEDAYQWSALESTIVLPTVAGQREYTLTGSGRRFRVADVLNNTEDISMQQADGTWIDRQYYLADVQNAAPIYYNFKGLDSNGDTSVELWPQPDAVYSLRFNLYIPTETLVNNADTVKVPEHLIQMLAYANAVAERGEDGGQSFSELYQKYRLALADAITLEANRYDEQVIWTDS